MVDAAVPAAVPSAIPNAIPNAVPAAVSALPLAAPGHLIGRAQRELMLGSVSIIASSSNRGRVPHLMRAVGCRLSAAQWPADSSVDQPVELQTGSPTDLSGESRTGLPSDRPSASSAPPAPGERVIVLMAASTCGDLLADIRSTGQVAVVFSEPTSARSIQLKGRDAQVLPAEPDDARIAADYVTRMVDEITRVGFDEPLVRAMLHYEDDDLVAICFTPTEAYEQTPGPLAGQCLSASSSPSP